MMLQPYLFEQQHIFPSMDTLEDEWLSKLNAKPNIQSMTLPLVK